MADFHSKIIVAHGFGIISKNQDAELNRIRAIRNVFAHASILVSFDTPEIAAEVDSFIMLKAMREKVSARVTVQQDGKTRTRKVTFLLMCQISCIILDHDQHAKTGKFLQEYDDTHDVGN